MEKAKNKERVEMYLEVCMELVVKMRRDVIDSCGEQCRNYTDEEIWYLDRLETAQEHVKKALFEIRRTGYRAEHETSHR